MMKSKSLEAVRERERELQFSKIIKKEGGSVAFICDIKKDRICTK